MSNLFYRRPRLLILALALILVAGFSALEVLPRSEDPELVSRNALVVTSYPGADAARVESQITEKIEAELEESSARSKTWLIATFWIAVLPAMNALKPICWVNPMASQKPPTGPQASAKLMRKPFVTLL